MVAVEVLLASPAVRKLVREQRVDEISDAMSTGGDGMQTFNRSLVSLYESKAITYETGAAYATNPDEFRLNAQGMERGSSAFAAEAEGLPAVGTVDMRTLLAIAVRYGASDIHMVVGSPPIFRIHGKLRRLEVDALSPGDVRELLFSLLSQGQREAFELDRELDFALTVTGKHRFRVNAHFQRGTVAVALRLIPNTIPDPATLGLAPAVYDLALRNQGLILVTGPTGSGKSTTLAAMIDRINSTRSCHVITIEDPIEFVHENRAATIEQRELGPDTASFASALKFILRQDPDVILVGEMRDQETISAALTAAETGHLVLATLHTNDAPQTVDRIVDVFPPHQQSQIRVQLSSALQAVVSQRPPAPRRRERPGRGLRGAHRHERRSRLDSRGQDAPDPEHDGDLRARWDGHDGQGGRRACPRGPRHRRRRHPLHAKPRQPEVRRGRMTDAIERDLPVLLREAVARRPAAQSLLLIAALCQLAHAGTEYVVEHRGALEHAIDVVDWWTRGQADVTSLTTARATVAAITSSADAEDDRAAWLSAESVAELIEAALDLRNDSILAAKHVWQAAHRLLDAMAWPEPDDPELRAIATERMHR